MPPQADRRFALTAAALSADLRIAAPAARRMGFGGLFLDAEKFLELSATGHREVRHVLSSNDQLLVGLRCDLGGRGFLAGADVDCQLSRLDRAMDAARKLAAPVVCVDLGPLPNPPPGPPAPPKPKPDPLAGGMLILPTAAEIAQLAGPPPEEISLPDPSDVDSVHAALAELAARSDRYGMPLAFSATLAPLAALHHVLASIDAPTFGVDLDPISLLEDRLTPPEAFDRLGPLVLHVRARDAIKGTAGRTRPAAVGSGDTDWPELLALLDDADYHGPVTLDPMQLPDRPAAAPRGLAHLRDARPARGY